MGETDMAKLVALQLSLDNVLKQIKYEKNGFSGIGGSGNRVYFRCVISRGNNRFVNCNFSNTDYECVVLPDKTKGNNVVIFKSEKNKIVDLIELANTDKFIYKFKLEFNHF